MYFNLMSTRQSIDIKRSFLHYQSYSSFHWNVYQFEAISELSYNEIKVTTIDQFKSYIPFQLLNFRNISKNF